MKKAQILSALALAFALGVAVIPTASTYAYVVDANDKLITKSDLITDLNTTIAEAKKIKTETEHNNYADLVKAVNGDATSATVTTSLNSVKDTQKGLLLTALTSSVSGFDKTNYDDASYKTVYDMAVAARKNAQDIHGEASTPYTTLDNAIKDADTAVDAAEVSAVTLIQAALTGTGWTGAPYMVSNFVKTEDGVTTADLAGAIAYAKNKAPEYNFYANLVAAIEKAEDVAGAQADTEKYTVAEAEAVLAALKAAMEGKTVSNDGAGEGSNKPEDNKPGQSAPDTGILAGAEGSASTTVAMVAGIATALTAAGAGVVAYRNARRSSRK